MELINTSYWIILWQVFLVSSILLWAFSLVDLLKSSFRKNDKVIWILTILFVPILGSILYLFIGRKQKMKFN